MHHSLTITVVGLPRDRQLVALNVHGQVLTLHPGNFRLHQERRLGFLNGDRRNPRIEAAEPTERRLHQPVHPGVEIVELPERVPLRHISVTPNRKSHCHQPPYEQGAEH